MGTTSFRPGITAEVFNSRGPGHLPGLVGVQIHSVGPEGLESRLEVRPDPIAPNGSLHAATVIALADTSCGYGTVANLPQGASGLTIIELKATFLGMLREGALFRCTQMVLWPKD